MEQSITLYDRIQDPILAVERLGTFLARSGIGGCTKVEQGNVLAWMCLARRMDPMEVTATYHIMDMGGRIMVGMRYDAMLAKLRTEAGGDYECVERTAERAEIAITDKKGKKRNFWFTWEEAQKEPFVWGKSDPKVGRLLKDKWATPRGRMQMLWARVVSDGIGVMAPEVKLGARVPEEAGDDEETTVTTEAPPFINSTERPPIDVEAEPEKAAAQEARAGADGKLSIETMVMLSNAIPGDLQDDGYGWLVANDWLKVGQEINCLSVSRAQRILLNIPAFVKVVKAWAEAQEVAVSSGNGGEA